MLVLIGLAFVVLLPVVAFFLFMVSNALIEVLFECHAPKRRLIDQRILDMQGHLAAVAEMRQAIDLAHEKGISVKQALVRINAKY